MRIVLENFTKKNHFPAVPSQTDPFPIGTEPYFNGGYNTERYGSKLGGLIDGIQIECNWEGVRNTEANRMIFANATAKVLRKYLETHYLGMDFLNGDCGLVSTQSSLQKDNLLAFRIFPNPASDELNIEMNPPISSEFSITIFNDLGQVFLEKKSYDHLIDPIEISHFSNGIYFIRIESNKDVYLERFLKMGLN